LIFIGLIAFFIIDVLLLVLFLRWDESRTKSGEESPKVNRGETESQASTPAEQVEKTTLPDKVTKPLSVETNVSASPETTQPAGGEHVFDLAHDKPVDAKESIPAPLSEAPPAHDGSSPSAVSAISLSKYSVDVGQVARERSYLRQKATILETRSRTQREQRDDDRLPTRHESRMTGLVLFIKTHHHVRCGWFLMPKAR